MKSFKQNQVYTDNNKVKKNCIYKMIINYLKTG